MIIILGCFGGTTISGNTYMCKIPTLRSKKAIFNTYFSRFFVPHLWKFCSQDVPCSIALWGHQRWIRSAKHSAQPSNQHPRSYWLVVEPSQLKHIRQIGNLSQIGVKINKYLKPPNRLSKGAYQKMILSNFRRPLDGWKNCISLL